MSERTYSGFPGFPGPKPDARLASEDAREKDVRECPRGQDCALNQGAVHCKHCGRNWPPDETWFRAGHAAEQSERVSCPEPPSRPGPDVETLAETIGTALAATVAHPLLLSAARAALSGLVALVEQRERERDDLRSLLHHEYRQTVELLCEEGDAHVATRERAEKAETLLARHRQALEAIRDVPSERYLLHYPVAREMHEIALSALAASAPGTEEPA